MKTPPIKMIFILFTGFFLLFTACNTNPTAPPNPTPVPTLTMTATASPTATPVVFWYSGFVYRDNNNGYPSVSNAQLILQVDGTAYDAAEVVLTGTNISTPVTLSFSGSTSYIGPGWLSTYAETGGWTYQVGESYTLTCAAMGVTTFATQSAPGNVTLSLDASGAVTLGSWATEGNNDLVEVYSNSTFARTYYDGPNLNSPVTIDPVAPYPSSGNYRDVIMVSNFTTSISNAAPGSAYSVCDMAENIFTK